SRLPSGAIASERTAPSWPRRLNCSSPVRASAIRTIQSGETFTATTFLPACKYDFGGGGTFLCEAVGGTPALYSSDLGGIQKSRLRRLGFSVVVSSCPLTQTAAVGSADVPSILNWSHSFKTADGTSNS